jgi:hypothetical protein
LPGLADRPRFREAARQDNGASHTSLHGLDEDGRDLLGGDGDHDHVGGFRSGAEMGIAGEIEDLGVLRVDGKDAAGVAEVLEIRDHACRAIHAGGGADDCDTGRLHQGRQIHVRVPRGAGIVRDASLTGMTLEVRSAIR